MVLFQQMQQLTWKQTVLILVLIINIVAVLISFAGGQHEYMENRFVIASSFDQSPSTLVADTNEKPVRDYRNVRVLCFVITYPKNLGWLFI